MKFLMDTDHISVLHRQSGPDFDSLSRRIGEHRPGDLAVSIVSFHEQVVGCNTYINRARHRVEIARGYAMLDRTLQDDSAAPVLPFDATASERFDGLVGLKLRVATMDLRIAAIALSGGLILLTRNVRDFGKVPGLLTENWTI